MPKQASTGSEVKELLVRLSADIGDYVQKMETASSTATKTESKLAGLTKAFGAIRTGLVIAGSTLVTTALTGHSAIMKMADDTIKFGNELGRLSLQTNVSVENLQKLRFASMMLDGNFDSLKNGVKTLTARLAGVADGLEKPTAALEELSDVIFDTNGNMKSMDEIFPALLKQLADMPDTLERDIKLQKIFGAQFQEIKPLLAEGGEALQAYMDKASEYGILTAEQIGLIDSYSDKVAEIGFAWESIKQQVAINALPAMDALKQAYLDNWDAIAKTTLAGSSVVIGGMVGMTNHIVGELIPAFNQLVDDATSSLDGYTTKAHEMADVNQKIMAWVSMAVQNAFIIMQNSVGFFMNILANVVSAIVQFSLKTAEVTLNIASTVAKGMSSILSALNSFVNSIAVGIGTTLGNIGGAVGSFFQNLVPLMQAMKIPQSVIDSVQNFGTGITNAGERARASFGSFNPFQGIANTLGDLSVNLSNISSNIERTRSQWSFMNVFSHVKPLVSYSDALTQIVNGANSAGEKLGGVRDRANGLGDALKGVGKGAKDAKDNLEELAKELDKMERGIDKLADVIKEGLKKIFEYQLKAYEGTYITIKKMLDDSMEEQLWFANHVFENRMDLLEKEKEAILAKSEEKKAIARQEYDDKIALIEKEEEAYGEMRSDLRESESGHHARRLSEIDSQKEAELDLVNQRIKAIDDLTKKEEDAERKANRKENADEIRKRYSESRDPEERARLRKQYMGLIKERDREIVLEGRELEKEKLEQSKHTINVIYDDKKYLEKEDYKLRVSNIETEDKHQKDKFKRQRNEARMTYDYQVEENKRVTKSELDENQKRIDEAKFTHKAIQDDIANVHKEGMKYLDEEMDRRKKMAKEGVTEENLNLLTIEILKTGNPKDWLDKNYPGWDKTVQTVGQQIIGGIMEGINDPQAAYLGVKKFFDNLMKEFVNIFDIHSPSGETVPVGEAITDGLIRGVGNRIPAMAEKLLQLKTIMLGGFRDAIGTANGIGSGVGVGSAPGSRWHGGDTPYRGTEDGRMQDYPFTVWRYGNMVFESDEEYRATLNKASQNWTDKWDIYGRNRQTGQMMTSADWDAYVNDFSDPWGKQNMEGLGDDLPEFAQGGIVNRPTIAKVGEAGPEAIIPLSGNKQIGNTWNITINSPKGTPSEISRSVEEGVRTITFEAGVIL